MTTIGDNSRAAHADEQLRRLIERLENLTEEIGEMRKDVTAIFKEAKWAGFDTKIMRHMMKLRKMTAEERTTLDGLIETYREALGLD